MYLKDSFFGLKIIQRYFLVRLAGVIPEADTFKGFFVQGRNDADITMTIGRFEVDVQGSVSRNCQGISNVSK